MSTNRRHVKYSFKDGMIITVSSCISESMSQTLPYWFGLTRDCLAIAARLFQIDSAQASVRKKPKQTPFFSDPKPSQMHIVMVRTRTNVSTSKWTEPVDFRRSYIEFGANTQACEIPPPSSCSIILIHNLISENLSIRSLDNQCIDA